MIRIVSGNMLEAKVDALVNTVNTVGVMGKGIALQFRKAFEHNYKVYSDACKAGSFHIGEVLAIEDQNINGKRLIINFPTKEHWRAPSKYEYVEKGLIALAKYLNENKVKSVALPPLGCGNGGLQWEVVRGMIEKHLANVDSEIFVYQPDDAVKKILQKEETGAKSKLTPARAMLLYSLLGYKFLELRKDSIRPLENKQLLK